MIKFLADLFKDNSGKPLACIKDIERIGQITIVRFCGRVDATTIPALSGRFYETEKNYFDRNILLDFREVIHVDSATLAYILIWLDKLQVHNRKIGVVNVSDDFDTYLTMDRVASIIRKYKNEAEALDELA